jgi:hypothetical protein
VDPERNQAPDDAPYPPGPPHFLPAAFRDGMVQPAGVPAEQHETNSTLITAVNAAEIILRCAQNKSDAKKL